MGGKRWDVGCGRQDVGGRWQVVVRTWEAGGKRWDVGCGRQDVGGGRW